jgi:hypothetical protein
MAQITINKQVQLTEEINVKKLSVNMGNSRDIDSRNLVVYYDGEIIGYGHLNNRTNMAHITLDEPNDELEDIIVNGIENRTINIEC